MRNKCLALLMATICLLLGIAVFSFVFSHKEQNLVVLDASGNTFAVLTKQDTDNMQMVDEAKRAYLEVVLAEAIQIVASQENCSENKAKNKLFRGGYTIETAFESTALQACESAYQAFDNTSIPFAAVVTATDGRILGVLSSFEDSINHVTEKTQPYSSFKPISVYAPALESGKTYWSKMYMDAPVKQIVSENGIATDWPTNSDGQYRYSNVSMCEGIKYSLNTTAIRCLLDVGVTNSIQFLQDKFHIDCTLEQRVAVEAGEEEVLSNIGLGYLSAGVSPLDMAGYYQIFATGGEYVRPYSVLCITKENGDVYFEHMQSAERVVSEETAYIMNQLLQNTLTGGGTAEKAQCGHLKIGGKTGTGSGYAGNWFVGFTPEYVCSIWHGKNNRNCCAELFPFLMQNLAHDESKTYPVCETVVQIPYCADSGKSITMQCMKMEMGYYIDSCALEKCNEH